MLRRAAAAGVQQVITVATDPSDWTAALHLAASTDEVYVAAGLHPHEARLADKRAFGTLADLLGQAKIVALGEIGLDYHYEFSTPQQQRLAFASQLELAGRRSLPVVVHCREAFDDTISILEETGMAGQPVVFHCFTGTVEQIRHLLDRGWYISFAGLVTFRSAREVQQAATLVPAERLLIETDSPYLTPEPIRKIRPNEPAHIMHTARFLSHLRGTQLAKLAEICDDNARRFFRLPRPGTAGSEKCPKASGAGQDDSRR